MRALFVQRLIVQRLIVQRWTILFAITICFVLYFIRLPYLDSPFICLFVVIVSASLVENLYKGDRQVKWEVYVNRLPLSKKVQLQSDFLFCYAFVLSLYILIAPLTFHRLKRLQILLAILPCILVLSVALFFFFLVNFIFNSSRKRRKCDLYGCLQLQC